MKCDFCEQEFKNKSSLNLHMRSAKYCLRLRGETPSEKTTYTCTDCGLVSTQKTSHDRHLRRCQGALGELRQDKFDRDVAELQKKLDEKDEVIVQKDKIIHDYELEVTELKVRLEMALTHSDKTYETLADIAKRPTTTTNTNNNVQNAVILQLKPLDYSVENVEEMFRVMEPETFRNGQRGIAQHLIKEMFTTPDGDKKMICTDPSRDIFKYLDLDKKIAKDCKLHNLIELCIEAKLSDKIQEFVMSIEEQDINNREKCILYQVAAECHGLKHNNSEFRSEFREKLTV